MDLSPEEKEKIYLEEKARIEAQIRSKEEIRDKKIKRFLSGFSIVIGGIVGLVLLLAIIGNLISPSS